MNIKVFINLIKLISTKESDYGLVNIGSILSLKA